jgi:hypothetical protein
VSEEWKQEMNYDREGKKPASPLTYPFSWED